MTNKLEVSHLCGERGVNQVIDDLSFSANAGELHQILGPNGSGKSTLLRLIAGLMPPEAGEIKWNNQDVHGSGREFFLRDSIFLGHKLGIAEDLTPIENLAYFVELRAEKPRVSYEEALQSVAFSASYDVFAGKISAGQKQRLALAKLALCEAQIWLLDEPFTALDKNGKQLIEDLLESHCAQGGIALVATHQAISASPETLHQVSLH